MHDGAKCIAKQSPRRTDEGVELFDLFGERLAGPLVPRFEKGFVTREQSRIRVLAQNDLNNLVALVTFSSLDRFERFFVCREQNPAKRLSEAGDDIAATERTGYQRQTVLAVCFGRPGQNALMAEFDQAELGEVGVGEEVFENVQRRAHVAQTVCRAGAAIDGRFQPRSHHLHRALNVAFHRGVRVDLQ